MEQDSLMERRVLLKNLQILEKAYEKLSFTQSQVDLWYECFKDCEEKDFELAVMNYIKGNEFPPVIAGVMKYYREIEDYKKEMKDFLFRQYMTLRSTWDEKQDAETMNEFVRIVCEYPKDQRKEAALDITHRAVSFHHDCEIEGRTAPSLIDYLRCGK